MAKTIGVVLSLQDKCTPVISKIAQRFGMTEKEAKRLNAELRKQAQIIDGQLKGAIQAGSVAIGAIAGATAMFINKTAEAGDRVDKMSQKIGLSRQKYQEWDYILSQSGSDIDKMQVGMKTLSQQMVASVKKGSDAEAMFKKLGVSVKDSNGNFIAQEEAFERVIIAFQKMPDGIEKANLAQKLFGKTGSDLRPLLNGVRGDVEELKKKYKELGMGMSDEAVDAAVKFTDTMDTVKRSFGAIGISIGTALMPHIQELAHQLINHLPQIKAALIPAINGFANAIGFVCSHLDIIIPAIGALVGAFSALQIITGITTFIGAFCNPVGAAVLGISALIAGLAAAYAKFEGFRSIVGAVVAVQKMLAVAVWKVIEPIAKACAIFIEWCSPLGQALKLIKALCGGINQLAQANGGWRGIGDNIKNWADSNTEKMQHHALGTSFAQGGSTLVGEYGPEIVNMPRGASVINANQTRGVLSGGGDVNVTLNIAGDIIGNKEFIEQLLYYMGIELRKVMPA